MIQIKSKRDNRVGGKLTFWTIGNFGFHFEWIGFAAARMDARAFNVAIIPAFATETVCCSYAN
jgi:hypothetical protein